MHSDEFFALPSKLRSWSTVSVGNNSKVSGAVSAIAAGCNPTVNGSLRPNRATSTTSWTGLHLSLPKISTQASEERDDLDGPSDERRKNQAGDLSHFIQSCSLARSTPCQKPSRTQQLRIALNMKYSCVCCTVDKDSNEYDTPTVFSYILYADRGKRLVTGGSVRRETSIPVHDPIG